MILVNDMLYFSYHNNNKIHVPKELLKDVDDDVILIITIKKRGSLIAALIDGLIGSIHKYAIRSNRDLELK